MTHRADDATFNATAGCIMLATSVAFGLIIYALLTLLPLLSTAPAQSLLGMTN